MSSKHHPNTFPKVLPNSPELHSYETDWKSISLESHCLPAAETPEFSLDHFAISINTGQGFQTKCWLERQVYQKDFFPGAIILCPPELSYRFYWNQPVNTITLNLAPCLLARSAVDLLKTSRFDLSFRFAFSDPLIQNIGLALQSDLLSQRPGGRIYAETLADALATHLLRRYSSQQHLTKVSKAGLSQRQVKSIVEFIDANLSADLGLEELSTVVGLSPSYFSRAFKQATGRSPHRYVIQQRVERAKQLLKQGDLSLSEVASACGFSHQSHLHRHFKRLTGGTPKSFVNS